MPVARCVVCFWSLEAALALPPGFQVLRLVDHDGVPSIRASSDVSRIKAVAVSTGPPRALSSAPHLVSMGPCGVTRASARTAQPRRQFSTTDVGHTTRAVPIRRVPSRELVAITCNVFPGPMCQRSARAELRMSHESPCW